MARFRFLQFIPNVKYLSFVPDYVSIMMGDMSYVSEGNLENFFGESQHVLIGKFCSISEGERFLCGRNKNYKSASNFSEMVQL